MSTISAFDSRTCGINVEILSTSRSLKELEIAAPILISSAVSFERSLTIYIPLLPLRRLDVSSVSKENAEPII